MALLSKGRLAKMMLDRLLDLPPGTKKLKDHVLLDLGSIAFLSTTRDLNAAWDVAKKKAAKNHADVFILDGRNALHWNDGSVKILDKKITSATFKKLNALAEKEGCNVNAMIGKLIIAYKKKK